MNKITHFLLILVTILFTTITPGCKQNNGDSAIVIVKANCAKEELQVQGAIVHTVTSGTHIYDVTATVTCAGEPLSEARFYVKVPWVGEVEVGGPTDSLGTASVRVSSEGDETDEKIKVEVYGHDSDEPIVEEVEIPPAQ